MAKESVWQRRARKCRSAKADYYPKVDLTETADGAEGAVPALGRFALPAAAPLAAAPANDVGQDAPPPSEDLDPPAAAPLAAALANEEAEEAPEDLDPPPAAPPAAPLAATPAAGNSAEAVPLPECLDLPAAKPLARALLERRGKPIVLDAAAVHQLGAQCVQVLLSARRTWDADGVPLSIVNCAPRMIEDLQLLGIDSTALMSGVQPQ